MTKHRRKKEYPRVRGDTGQHRRILAVGLILGFLGFIPVCIRLYKLMVSDYDYYAGLALRNQSRTTAITAQRGLIYDRNMNILVCNESVENEIGRAHVLNSSHR